MAQIDQKITTETVLLEKIRFDLAQLITPGMLQDLKVKVIRDTWVENIVAQIRWTIAGKHLKTIWYPKDWWQAFKERWFRGWVRRRYPVVYRVVDIKALYPDIALPSRVVSFVQQRLEDEVWTVDEKHSQKR